MDPASTARSPDALWLSGPQAEWLRERLSQAVRRVCPFWLAHEREDLVQTALLRILGLIKGHEAPLELTSTYLWKTAYSVTLDEIRRARWRFERTMDDVAQGEEKPGVGLDPERAASSRETSMQIRGCLRDLERPRRRAVLLRLAGYGHDESAQRLGMSVKQIANLVHRGMKDLRGCLRAKGVTA